MGKPLTAEDFKKIRARLEKTKTKTNSVDLIQKPKDKLSHNP